MRSRFISQLAQLNRELISMGALCEEAIALAVKAVIDGDVELAAKVAPIETEIDQKERDIERASLKLLLLQQPVATDLRQISAALKMITDMERIGDQAYDIAEIVKYLKRPMRDGSNIANMGRATITMVTDSIDAFVKQDVDLAIKVLKEDDYVDELFAVIKGEVVEHILNTPEDGEYAMDILMIAKYFERIGDHATNIAEWVVFSITGEHKTEEDL